MIFYLIILIININWTLIAKIKSYELQKTKYEKKNE